MINPKKELFIWGPIDGRPIYVSYFMRAIASYLPKLYLYKLPEVVFFFIKTKMTFISDFSDLIKCGRKYFNNWIMDDNNFEKVKKDYKNALGNLKELQNKITKEYLDSLSDKELENLYEEWHNLYLRFWDVGLVPELANWGGEQWLKEKLKFIRNESEFLRVLEKLSAPENLSFYQKEELELLSIKNISDKALEAHSNKYFWIGNSYFEQKILKKDYFKEILSKMDRSTINKRIGEIKGLPENAKNAKEEVFTKYNLDEETRKLSKRLSYSIWWQDARKEEIFIANHYVDLFLKQISNRKKIKFLDLKFYAGEELLELLKGKKVTQSVISERKKKCLFHYYKDKLAFETGEGILGKIKPFLEEKIEEKIDTIRGMVASIGKGYVKGKVRILLTPRNVNKMKKGEILVAPMTSPDYVIAMKKAAAIVTDSGGITSHAAIVSRELGVPCIVGTKIATKVLKDGMEVEIKANHGIVRIVK